MAHLTEGFPKLIGSEPPCPKPTHGCDPPLWKGFQIRHRDFLLGHRMAGQTIVVMIPLMLCRPSTSRLGLSRVPKGVSSFYPLGHCYSAD